MIDNKVEICLRIKMKKSCCSCKLLERCSFRHVIDVCPEWQESELSKYKRKASEYFERSKAKTNEIALLKQKLSDNTETINTERMKVDMLERKLETSIEALEKIKGA